MSSKKSWDLMKNYSVLPERNLQFLQFIPGKHSLKLGVHQMDGTIASQAHILRFNTIALFKLPSSLKEGEEGEIELLTMDYANADENIVVFPIPAKDKLQVSLTLRTSGNVTASIYNLLGAQVIHNSRMYTEGTWNMDLDISLLQQGTYFLRVNSPDGLIMRKFTIIK